MSHDDSKIVDFQKAEVTSEERARRLKSEVDRLASMPVVEWMFYLAEGAAEKHGVSHVDMKKMIEATIKDREKKEREDRAEDHRSEQRAEKEEKKESKARHEEERKRKEEEREQRHAAKEEERKRKDREKAFEAIAKLPRLAHKVRLAELGKRSGEDLDMLRAEFEAFVGPEEMEDKLDPWDEAVETKALLNELTAQLRRYVVMHDDVAVAISLWTMFAWVHELAVHSPLLVITSAEPDAGKTTSLGVLHRLTPEPYLAAELTGPNLYRIVDHLHPTLIVDDADMLFQRRADLTHIVNISWTRGTKVPRQVQGTTYRFDPFCPKVLGMVGLSLSPALASRCIVCKLQPKLPSEQVADFSHDDDDDFRALRRKAMRWAADHAVTLRDACPVLPPGFGNRLRMNWNLLLAIADLAGGAWPKRAREAAIKLSKRHRPSEGRRLIDALRPILAMLKEITSADLVARLNADPTAEWCAFRNRGPITQRQVALLLDQHDIHPDVIHPPGRPAARGYKAEWFADVFARYPPLNRTTVRKSPEKRRK